MKMKIIAVDDEELALYALNMAICEALPETEPVCFREAAEALAYAQEKPVDVAFLDADMGAGMSGLELAKALLAIRPTTNIIFVTGYSEYLEDAFALYASGYVKKPVRVRRILKEMANLRYPLTEKRMPESPYTIDQTTQRVHLRGRDMLLTPKEYQLFCLLAGSAGVFFAPEEIYRRIWGSGANDDVRSVYRHMSKLRAKLEMSDGSDCDIEVKRGVGYRFVCRK